MDEDLRQVAVADILHYWRRSTEITVGKQLSDELGVEWKGEHDDYRVAEALKRTLQEELERLRSIINAVEQRTSASAPPKKVGVRAELASKKQDLDALTATWDYYIDGLEVVDLIKIYNVKRGAILNRAKRGVRLLAASVARRANERTSKKEDERDPRPDKKSIFEPVDEELHQDTPVPAPEAMDPDECRRHERPTPPQFRRTASHNSNWTYVEINLPPESAPNQPPAETSGAHDRTVERLQAVVIVLLMMVWAWLTFAAAWASISILLLIAGWRTAVYARHAVHARRERRDEETAWQLYAMFAWLAILCVAAFVLSRVSAVVATPPPLSGDRLGLVLQALCIGAGVLLLGLMDFLFWIHQYAPPWGPWRPLASHAEYAVEHRWETVTLSWGLLALLGVVLLTTTVF